MVLGTLEQIFNSEWWWEKLKNTDLHRLGVSFWSCLSFIGLGVSLVVFAPTLLDIAHQLDVGVGLLSVVFLTRAIGGVIGTVASGVLMDRFPGLQYTLLCCFLFGGIAANILVPVAVHVAMLAVIMFFMGITLGGLDNGAHAILMRLWGDKSGPCMQFLHAAFAMGAFLAPLIAKPFITDIPDTQEDFNTSQVFNISCSNVWTSNCENISHVECACLDSITEVCNQTSSAVIDVYYDMLSNQSNCSVINEELDNNITLRYGWAYWISAMFFVVPLLAFTYYSIRYDMTHCFKTRKNEGTEGSPTNMAAENQDASQVELNEVADDNVELLEDSEVTVALEDSTASREPVALKTYKYPAFFLLFWFMLFYVGSEVSYGSLLFTFSVKSQLRLDKQTAATVTAVFWGLFLFMRVFSILLVMLKVRASVMMTLNVSGSVTAILILAIFPHNRIAVWVTSALLGASFASIFPTAMTWMSEHLPVSGKAAAVLNGGGNIGDIALPSLITALIGNVHPDYFVYSILSLIVLSTTLLVLLFVMTGIYQRRHKPPVKSVGYHRLTMDGSEPLENGGVSSAVCETEPDEEKEAI